MVPGARSFGASLTPGNPKGKSPAGGSWGDARAACRTGTWRPGVPLPSDECAEASPVEQERRVLLLGDAEDLADDDQVIAAVVVDGVEALEPGQRSVKERRIAKTGLERDAGEIAAPGEMLGQWPLIRGKDMDREVARCLEGRKAGRLARRRPQDEGRIERHGREAVDRHPERPTRGHRGDDRHPGRETAERTTQVVLREFLHAASPAASETDVVGRTGAKVAGPETVRRQPSADLVIGD